MSLLAELSQPKFTRREAANLLGKHVLTIDRYSRVGYRNVKLARRRIGGTTYILAADLEAFLRATSGPDPDAVTADADADAEAAERELAALGLAIARAA